MDSKDAATRSIIATHGSQIGGYTVKSSWGKDMSAEGGSSQQSSSSNSSNAGMPPRPPGPPQQPVSNRSAEIVSV